MIAIIDYKAGNTRSVINALNRLGQPCILTDDADIIMGASKVILPGVGHAANAMIELKNRNLIELIKEIKVPFLGICLGMQLLMDYSDEGDTRCLGLINGAVKKFDNTAYKVPNIGWNNISFIKDDNIYKNLNNNSFMYFVHSYFVPLNQYTIATSDYTQQYTSIIKKDNFYGVQFHPEKSGKAGEIILINFLNL